MKRRQFLYQALSASAVVVGTGYATVDMIRRSSDKWAPSQTEQARKAAQKALRHAPLTDEGMSFPATAGQNSAAQGREAGLPFAQPAESLTARGPAFETPNQPSASRASASLSTPAGPTRPDTPTPPTPSSAETTLAESVEKQVKQATETASRASAGTGSEQVDESEVVVEAPEYVAEAEDQSEKVRQKVQHFEYDFSDDIFITEADYTTLVSALDRMNRVEAYVGHGNFNVMSFDDMLKYGRYQPRIGQFTEAELNYLEQLFYDDVSRLGFFGERIVAELTHTIKDADIEKIPGTGHYLFKGHSEDFYNQVRDKVGDSLVLTSGIRGVVKQYHLFMAKVVQAEGNLSRASRSLAPPGHSYHAIGDFDVGRVGGGYSNFTSDFAETDEFKRLQDLGFVQIRYTSDNNYGVRYEPWHIRVV